ncbi:unnamed protein product [Ceratitis capitata]|uniref:(Mediterranean fruit fly) hypothetical protein n=1 Tax=Ceratitis capitata TaxID=7213 RepID=A0A811U5Z8_CERCA|nr:unnamed protein product [Ceratitis capitata]
MHENHVSACGHVHVLGVLTVVSRLDCLELCLGENEFTCRHQLSVADFQAAILDNQLTNLTPRLQSVAPTHHFKFSLCHATDNKQPSCSTSSGLTPSLTHVLE